MYESKLEKAGVRGREEAYHFVTTQAVRPTHLSEDSTNLPIFLFTKRAQGSLGNTLVSVKKLILYYK